MVQGSRWTPPPPDATALRLMRAARDAVAISCPCKQGHEMSWLEIDWKYVRGVLMGGVGMGILTYLGWHLVESRRRIAFSVPKLYFGPTLTAHRFMGRNYPNDDLVSLDCSIRFFSHKSLATGLDNFRVEFCRTTYMGAIPEFTPDQKDVHRNLLTGGPYKLEALELPSRQFVTFDLSTAIERKDWPALRLCDCVFLRCETAEGAKRRFRIGRITFPGMPPEGHRGINYLVVDIWPRNSGFIIRATRTKASALTGWKEVTYSGPDQMRYWDGMEWNEASQSAKFYPTHAQARSEGEALRIWDRIPAEWHPERQNG